MNIRTMRFLQQHTSIVFLVIVFFASNFPFSSTTSTSSFATTEQVHPNNEQVHANNEEVSALLKWKSSLDKQSQSLLSSWVTIRTNQSNHCNSWFGISCNKAGRVDDITIISYGLRGKLSDLNFSSLNHLTAIDLYNNSFFGTIPSLIGSLGKLTYLDLSLNLLSGTIPSKLCELASLKILHLSTNNLVGVIPQEIGQLKDLIELDFSTNNLSGSIPSSIGNLSSLKLLYLYENKLVDTIPPEIGQLTSLRDLEFSNNSLTGPIPISLNNITELEFFEIGENHFIGQLPHNICQSGSLKHFGAKNNNLSGNVPKTLKTCMSLRRVRLDMNHLTGNISEDFGVYPHLNYLDLSYNNFYGEVSRNWGSCHNLTTLMISNNKLTGSIPTEIGLAQKLQRFDLSSNHLIGQVPKTLGKLLFDINLSNNQISGSIPPEIGDLLNLETLNLAENNLSGFVPIQLTHCSKLWLLNLSKNKLAGDIPSEIGNFHYLESLDLAQNLLSGKIPQQIGQLARLETLNLSRNKLSDSIPDTFNELNSLITINLSYNQLEGPIPNNEAFQRASFDAFKENKDLCGSISGLKACHVEVRDSTKKKKNKGIETSILVSIISFPLLILFILGFLVCIRNRQKIVSDGPCENIGSIFSIWSYDGKLVYKHIIEETENFDEKYCIGVGGSGAVFKIEKPNNQVFAVKKLHSVEHGELNNQKAFISEINALTEIRHRNIVKLYGFCSHLQHSFLVYEFLEGGDLNKILIDEYKSTRFEWTKRIHVIEGITNGLSYMHHECSPPIVHRDISSKNILLDTEYVAHISDFGTARILKTNSTNCTSFAGTFGYAAPELAHTMEVTEMQDVYSFGVLTLEILMGKHPGDLVSQISLSANPSDEFKSTSLKDVLDPRLPIPRTTTELEDIVCCLKLAFSCLQVNPHQRPTMNQVSTELLKPRSTTSIFSLHHDIGKSL